MIYHVYSDCSIRDRCGLAWAIHLDKVEITKGGIWIDETQSKMGELRAMECALAQIPNGVDVTVHSDLDDIEWIIEEKCSYSPKLSERVAEIKRQCERFRAVLWLPDARKFRAYNKCHRRARMLAVAQ